MDEARMGIVSPFPSSRSPLILVLLLLFTLAPCPVSPAPLSSALAADWQANFTVSVPDPLGGRATQGLAAGVRLTAQDGFDNAWDAMAMGGATLSAYFYHPDYAAEKRYLVRDFRADGYPKQWDIYVASGQNGQLVTMGWSLPHASPGSCLGMTLTLTDLTAGTPVDLTQPSYVYTNSAAAPRRFTLTATQTAQSPPPVPLNLYSPRTGTTSLLLAWSGVADPPVAGYHLYRKAPGAADFARLTASPLSSARYLDGNLVPGGYAYFVTAVTAAGCESSPSNALSVTIGQ